MVEKKKKTTIDDLAAMVQKGFAGVEENRLKGIDTRLDKMEIDIQNLKFGQKQILQKLEGVDKERIDGIDERVKDIEDLFAMPAKK